ncbi:MAG: SDR family NAD(P)-dependent oxidoreductase [Candidatus Paceibacterota bacterium]|jgi:NAD(P)-dependent dehydrogenase (short-subunit alcohol dehydrogenase family)
MVIKERTVIVTGVGSAVVRGIAHAFAKEGYNVVVSDPDYAKAGEVANEIIGLAEECLAVKCDVVKKEDTDELLIKTLTRYKKVDVLVNGTEIFPFNSFENISISDWELLMNTNLRGALLCSQAAVREMKEGGKIINISSVAAQMGWNGLVLYSASKGGMEAMTRAMAVELAMKKINVNAVAVGIMDIPGGNTAWMNEASEKMTTTAPERRLGKPEDVAEAVVFLASNKANYITGQVITVDGGYTIR